MGKNCGKNQQIWENGGKKLKKLIENKWRKIEKNQEN